MYVLPHLNIESHFDRFYSLFFALLKYVIEWETCGSLHATCSDVKNSSRQHFHEDCSANS